MNHLKFGFRDRLGIYISIACIAHCILLPLLIGMLPWWTLEFVSHEWAHPLSLLFIAPLVYRSIRQNPSRKGGVYLLLTGVTLFIVSWLLHESLGRTGEMLVAITGSVFLVMGHFRQHHYIRHFIKSTHTADDH